MKLPNGFGSVVKLSGNRRNPYAVRKTKGFDERGYPDYLFIGYAPTKEAGFEMLVRYNKDPWNVDQQNITLKELFELYKKERFDKLGSQNRGSLNAAFKHCKKYYKHKYRRLKSFHMQDCVDSCDKSYATKNNIRNLFIHLDNFALELDIINKSYAQLVKSSKVVVVNEKVPFSKEEIELLWNNLEVPYVDVALILIYSGFRVSGLLQMKNKDINLEDGYFKGGIKTDAGKDRIVPIHSLIHNIVISRYSDNNTYFIQENNKRMTYRKFLKHWKSAMNELNLNHTPHECRHTFRSMLDTSGANKTAIDLMLGHKSQGTGERVYTHKTLSELRDNIELVTR